MKKSKLGGLPLSPRTIPQHNEKKWHIQTELIKIEKTEYLIVNLFYKGNEELTHRIFFDGKEYITQSFEAGNAKWLTGSLSHITNIYWSGTNKQYCSKESAKVIQYFFKSNDDDGYKIIEKYQETVLAEKLNKKHRKETNPIDELMINEIKPLPEDFDCWVDESALYKSRYVFYQYKARKKVDGYCTHCKQEIVVENPLHNKQGICPNCKSEITFKSIGKSKNVTDRSIALIFQTTEKGFITRAFGVTKQYKTEFKKPKIIICETQRNFYDNKFENVDGYRWEYYKQHEIRWCHNTERVESGIIYSNNIGDIMKSSVLKYSGLDLLLNNYDGTTFSFQNYLSKINHKNCLEKLIKSKLFRLTSNLINNYNLKDDISVIGTNPNEILKISNDDIKILQAANVSLNGLIVFRELRDNGKRLTVEQLSIINEWDQLHLHRKMLKYMSVGKLLKYLVEQRRSDKLQIWYDYLTSCESLNYDMRNTFVLFPKHLKAAHDENIKLLEIKADEKAKKEAGKQSKEINRMQKELDSVYGFDNKKYFIRAPKSTDEIIEEGQILHHCVGRMGYIERMAKGQTVILFLRKKEEPDKPYYTIEVKEDVLRQCHGFGNEDKDYNKIKSFVESFKRVIKSRHEKTKIAV